MSQNIWLCFLYVYETSRKICACVNKQYVRDRQGHSQKETHSDTDKLTYKDTKTRRKQQRNTRTQIHIFTHSNKKGSLSDGN